MCAENMPKICNKAVYVLLKMRLQYVQNVIKIMSKYVSGLCLLSSDKICQNVTKYVQYLLKLCLYCVQIMLKISSEYVQNPFKKLSTFCSKSAQNLLKISPTSH